MTAQSGARHGDHEKGKEEKRLDALVKEVLRLRDEPPYFTDEDIRRAREELRK